MNSERMGRLAERAAVHAALGDPARLRIVDTLLVGDASPSELAAMLGMRSNLLAHHLSSLESAGLVSRHHSEADGRRTYLRLERQALERLRPAPIASPERIVFVCTANSARSHLAAALWRRSSRIPTASAGTHPADRIDPGAIAAAERHDLVLPRVHPRHLDQIADDGDLIVTVCDMAHEELGDRSAVHWSVPDPARLGTPGAFDSAYDDLSARVDELAHLLPSAS